MARADAVAKSMQAKDAVRFWKRYTQLPAMWKTHFESLLNNVTTAANMQNVKEFVQNTEYLCYGNNLLITPCIVQNVIDKLKSGKASGNDGLSTEHFIHSDRCITILLLMTYVLLLPVLVDFKGLLNIYAKFGIVNDVEYK